ncbi:hypothetical protein EVC14_010 [Rhizobium phage RHph_I3_18]|nr:hypothetical protein EVC14_010 [Rhizobium phage RHph_I3_18]
MAEDSRLIVTFESHPVLNESKSKELGRPYFDDMEVCRIRMAGDRLQLPVFPAWAEAPGGIEDPETGLTRPGTYKEKYAAQYKAFKAGERQTKNGTPLEALPFLTPAKVKELKAVHVYTAEALADLDGANLKTLGQGGREWKEKAKAYLENASDSAYATKLAEENLYLKQQLEALQNERAQFKAPDDVRLTENLGYDENTGKSQFEDWEDELIKEWIAEKSGSKPRGNPSHATLVKMADELAR